MRIRSLKLNGIRSLPSAEWEFPLADSGPDILAITGPRSSGKTTFLDAIAAGKEQIAAYGLPDHRWQWLVPVGERAASVQFTLTLSAGERERLRSEMPEIDFEAILGEPLSRPPLPTHAQTTLLGTWSPDREVGRMAYFQTERSLPTSGNIPPLVNPNLAVRLGGEGTKYNRLSSIVLERREPQLSRASEMLLAATGLGIAGAEMYRTRQEIVCVNPSTKSRVFESCLSSTERQALLFALAFADPGFNESIVLIDTPEMAFGDAGALELVSLLSSWGRQNQIIVATSSQALLSRLPRTQVVVLS